MTCDVCKILLATAEREIDYTIIELPEHDDFIRVCNECNNKETE